MTMYVTDTQLLILRQQAALCNFRAQSITVHECMIVGQYITNIGQLHGDSIDLTQQIGLLTEAMRRDGFKGQQKIRMLSAARMYLETPVAQRTLRAGL